MKLRYEDNIKETRYLDMDWLEMAQERVQWWILGNTVMNHHLVYM
jgi:hypothetical protein